MIERDSIAGRITSEFGYHPLEALNPANAKTVPKGRSINEDVFKVLRKHGAELLLPYLTGEDTQESLNAVYIFSEMGGNTSRLVDAATKYISHTYGGARRDAMEGLLPHASNLSACVLAECLRAASDVEVRVRIKAIDFLAALPIERIESAQDFLTEQDHADQHKKGLEVLRQKAEIESLIDQVAGDDKVVSCYICAKILRLAKSGSFMSFKDKQINCGELDVVRAKVNVLKRRAEKNINKKGVNHDLFEFDPTTLKVKGPLT